jgi:transposase
MNSPEDVKSLSREDLLALVAELQRQVMALQEQVAQLAADKQELQAEVDRLTRQSKRQATPFSKGTRSNQPKRPGRKPGEGTFSFRRAPRPEEITESAVNVPVTRESCPGCGGNQYGATAHRLGPRAMAAAHALHYQVGIPVRKVPLVLNTLTGLVLTQGAITQDALRRARGRVGQVYQELRAGVRHSPVVYTDDTG